MNQIAIFCMGWLCMFYASLTFSANLPTGFVEQLLVDGLNPVGMTIDHHGNIWIIEKHGMVQIVDHHGELLPDPFLQLPVDDYNERGLLGIALHPDFDVHPYVYLYYTVVGANHNRVSRFLANGNLAVPGSEEVLIDLDPLSGFVHNGGAMLFGPDSMLYIATGEAAHPPFSQDLNSLHGKILRLHPDGTIPTDNPFYTELNGRSRSIWVSGLRNPFAFAQDPITYDFLTIDVGAGDYEEINRLQAGKNYGWPIIEGPRESQEPPEAYQDPLYSYDHDLGCSIVGAAFNRNSNGLFPQMYDGHFFFADYCDGYIKSLDLETGIASLFADQINRPLAITFDQEEGVMYYLTRGGIGGGSAQDNTSTQQGQLWQVRYTGDGSPFVSAHPKSTLISIGENAEFHVQASGAPVLTYQWFQDGSPITGANESSLLILAPALADSGRLIYCVVSNAEGTDTSQAALLAVTQNQRPMPIIERPIASQRFQAGDTIHFTGKAIDPEEGELEADRLSWHVVWHHRDHTHPGTGPFEQVDSGYWVVPTVNETDTLVWYRLHLRATDSQGMARTISQDFFPEISAIHIDGPVGVEVNIDGRIRTLPHTFYSLVGLQRIVEAQMTTIVGDQMYRFDRWKDGLNHPLWEGAAPTEGLQLELVYDSFILGSGTGLMGHYFNDSLLGFDTEPVLERLEPEINFLWGNGSPEKDVVNQNYFTAQWEGDIQAIFDEIYTFHTRSDDGLRLWIGEELLIDKWQPQAPTEHSADIWLEAGKRYPFRLEYFEKDGGAEMVLTWSAPSIPKSFIPTRQLYPEHERFPGSIQGEVWLDANDNHFREREEFPLSAVPVLLLLATDSSVVARTETDETGSFQFDEVSSATYFLQFLSQATGKWLQPGSQLDLFGRTPPFVMEERMDRNVSVTFIDPQMPWFIPFPNLKVYPQPAHDRITLSFSHPNPKEVQATLIDMKGKQSLIQTWMTKAGANEILLPLGDLPSGIYVLRLQQEEGMEIRKIIKW